MTPDAIPPSQPEARTDPLQAAAQAHFLSLLDGPDAQTRAAVAAWRKADPAHEQAFRKIEAGWQVAGGPAARMAAQDEAQIAAYLARIDRAKTRKRVAVALCALLALGAGGGVWLERPHLIADLAADYVSPRGAREQVTLADGTKVLLDADSALIEDFSASERRVRLLRGAAFFDVTPGAIPFIVSAAEGEVRVMGTGFDVRLQDTGADVTLEHGSVALTAGGQPLLLEPGQKASFDRAGIGPVQTVDLGDALAWRGGRYTFYRARLSDVLNEIGRYRAGRIVVTSASLAEARVTGSFVLDDSDTALAALQASLGFRQRVLAGRLTIISP
ncbi:FecR family protein [Gemmobacter serpentinus]|uniref:FecR family protein n=1 Tax=Gemmobacter serpentinus TaxID=2652247 RepID=UPI00124DD99A|nr:FecR domain-containing protein [Gemmobacter serpentinus]